jgi:hypothetical protein
MMAAAGLVAMTVAGVATSPVAAHSSSDLFRRCATKALRGDFGKLKPWQRNAYQRGMAHGVRTSRVWLTVYRPPQYRRGEGTAYGYGCSEEVAACNALPRGTVVWVQNPAHLRVVGDTGAKGNDRIARRRGGEFWLDAWIPHRGWRGLPDSSIAAVAVIPKGGSK